MTYDLVEAAGIEPEASLFYIVNSDTCGADQHFGSTFSILGLLLGSFSSPWTTQYRSRESYHESNPELIAEIIKVRLYGQGFIA